MGRYAQPHTFAAADPYGRRRAITDRPTIPTVVRLMKGAVSKQAGFPVWQKGFYDHVVRNQRDYLDIWNYIEGNPGKWEEDVLYIGSIHTAKENDK